MTIHDPAIAWAYFAGFFDGEGSIGVGNILKPKPVRPGERWNANGMRRQLYVRLSITNTYRPVLEEFAALIGGQGGIYIHERKRENRRQAFVLVSQKMSVVKRALEGMLPYLHEKKHRAELALQYIESRKVGATRTHISAAEFAIYERLRSLNVHGDQRVVT